MDTYINLIYISKDIEIFLSTDTEMQLRGTG